MKIMAYSTSYPLSPSELPNRLTSLSLSYKIKALLAALSVLLFFVLYSALVLSLAYLVYYAIIYDIESVNKFTILLKIGAIAGAVMLFVFTLKFLFKVKNVQPSNRLRLDKSKHPELVSFVNKICKETGAPKPKNIYVDPDVNAYVSYSNMWLSLILPVKKDLTIGLGLVSCLNLTEFKAVVSHEFGHFSQSSMKIGSYINSANTIIHDMIFNHDSWDDALDSWRGADLRLSIAAWVITPIIWCIRQVLNLFYMFLNFMYSSLSREMEFNADKVAVKTTGSEAIVSALWRLDNGLVNWNLTMETAYLASKKKLFTPNLYDHNNKAISRSTSQQSTLLDQLPLDSNGRKQFFPASENSKVGMYASHPANDLRERNAKTPFINGVIDDRSPWILFSDVESLQHNMTKHIYEVYLGKKPKDFASIETIESFIEAENQGKELMKKYKYTFENRFFNIPSASDLEGSISLSISEDSLLADLDQLMKPVNHIDCLLIKAQEIAQGTTNEKFIVFQGKSYDKKNLEIGYEKLITERELLFDQNFKEWDTKFCQFFIQLAKADSKEYELLRLYNQHTVLAKFYRELIETKNKIFANFQRLQGKGEVSHSDITMFSRNLFNKMDNLNKQLNSFNQLDFEPLLNIDSIYELQELIIEGRKFPLPKGAIFENGLFERITEALDSSILHCQKIDQKSIIAILTFHEKILKMNDKK